METKYIALLRGINVSGYKTIRMDDLKSLFEGLDFGDVKTYIQSGNVVFTAANKLSDGEMAERIQQAITGKYNFFVPVIIRSQEEMMKIMSDNPFLKENEIDTDRLYITFLADNPRQSDKDALSGHDFSPERFSLIRKEVYLYCPKGYGNTKISNLFFENRLKVNATTRNWKTVGKLVDLTSK